jgi:hypothetical protein
MFLTAFGLLGIPVGPVIGQQIMRAHAGIIECLQGKVLLDNIEMLLWGACSVQNR